MTSTEFIDRSDLTEWEFQLRIEDIEAEPSALESCETVERVARAIAQVDYDSEIDEDAFEYAFDELQRDEFRRYAVAAITALSEQP
jgi:hypothetical protein